MESGAYPEPICMICGNWCEIWEEVRVCWGTQYPEGFEVWCYCPACDVETFHPIGLSADFADLRR